MSVIDSSQKAHDLKKKVKGLSRIEKGKIYGGDKTIMYEKLGLVEESDLERYRKKFGLKKGIDLTEIDINDVDAMLEASTAQKEATPGTLGNPKKR